MCLISSGHMTCARGAPAALCLRRSPYLCRAFVCVKIAGNPCVALPVCVRGAVPVRTVAGSPFALTCGQVRFDLSPLHSVRCFVLTLERGVAPATMAQIFRTTSVSWCGSCPTHEGTLRCCMRPPCGARARISWPFYAGWFASLHYNSF